MSQSPATPSVPPGLAAPGESPPTRPVLRPIPRWVIAIGVPAMVLVAVAAVWLLLGIGVAGDKLDAIRTGGTLGVGLGGVVVLWLAVRRQRSTELDLLQKYEAHQLAERVAAHNQAHQQQVAKATQDDAVERRITELYTKAADQLGSDKAPVRLAGLYALERLAQDTPRLRQTIVNVICAYLRMPYTPPASTPANAPRPLGRRRKIRPAQPMSAVSQLTVVPQQDLGETARQEREVRLTAQAILATHLKPGHPMKMFWGDINLDLTDATLINLDLRNCHIGTGRYSGATFTGVARFDGARFTGDAEFDGATFTRVTKFDGARFDGDAWFDGATFKANAEFDGATFTRVTRFNGATFTGTTEFENATFTGIVGFEQAKFAGDSGFENTTFGDAVFDGATFAKDAVFDGAKFAKRAWFRGVTFEGGAPPEVARLLGSGSAVSANEDAEPRRPTS